MRLCRKSELTAGSEPLTVTTDLRGADRPAIETRVVRQGKLIFRRATDIGDLRPIFKHGQEIFGRIDSQHQSILQKLKAGELDLGLERDRGAGPLALETALSYFSHGDLERATRVLRDLLDHSPIFSEARELLEVVDAARSGAQSTGGVSLERLKEGAEALAKGRRRHAIELWKRCLAKEPSNRVCQLLVLSSTAVAPERRHRYFEELFSLAKKLLAEGRTAEAYTLMHVYETSEGESHKAETGGGTAAEEDAPSRPPEPTVSTAPEEPATAAQAPAADAKAASPRPKSSEARPEPGVTDPTLTLELPAVPVPWRSAGARPAAPRPEGEQRPSDSGAPQAQDGAAMTAPRAPRPRRPSKRWSWGRGVFPRLAPSPSLLYLGGGALLLVLVVALTLFLVGGEDIPVELLEEASGHLTAGQYGRAAEAYSRILSDRGEIAPAYVGRGRARLALGELEGGLADLRRAVELDPENGDTAEELADVLYSRERFEEAVKYYQQALAAGGEGAEACYRLASSLVHVGRSDEALSHLETAIEADRAHGEAHFLYGTLLNEQERYAEAERALRAARSYMDGGGDYYAELGVALLGQGKLTEAEEVARTLLRHDRADARSHALLGEVYLSRKQYEPARAELIRALRLNSRERRAQIALGRTWLAIGKTRGDQRDLAKARQILESAQGVHEGERLLTLAQVSMAEGDMLTAVSLLERSLGHGAKPLSVRLSLAAARFAADDPPGAAAELQRAGGMEPANPRIALSLGVVYSELEDPRRASEQYLKAIQGAGLTAPPEETNGPVMLPPPYIPLPAGFDVNRAMHKACRQALALDEQDTTAAALKALVESTSFAIAAQN